MVGLCVLIFAVTVYYAISIPKMLKVFAVVSTREVSSTETSLLSSLVITTAIAKIEKKANNITIIMPEEIGFDYRNES